LLSLGWWLAGRWAGSHTVQDHYPAQTCQRYRVLALEGVLRGMRNLPQEECHRCWRACRFVIHRRFSGTAFQIVTHHILRPVRHHEDRATLYQICLGDLAASRYCASLLLGSDASEFHSESPTAITSNATGNEAKRIATIPIAARQRQRQHCVSTQEGMCPLGYARRIGQKKPGRFSRPGVV